MIERTLGDFKDVYDDSQIRLEHSGILDTVLSSSSEARHLEHEDKVEVAVELLGHFQGRSIHCPRADWFLRKTYKILDQDLNVW